MMPYHTIPRPRSDLFCSTHRAPRSVAGGERLGTERRLLGARDLLERGGDGERPSSVLDQSRALAVAALHHSGRLVALLHAGSYYIGLLFYHCTYHLDQESANGLPQSRS